MKVRLTVPARTVSRLYWGTVFVYNNSMEKTPNWQHNSGKVPSGRGCCKGKIRASKQKLKALKTKLKVR